MLLFTHILKLSLILLILIPEWSHAEERYKETSKELLPLFDRSDIIIIGESHGKEESTRLLSELAGEATHGGGCMTVALEIGSEHQEVVDAAMTGKANIARLAWPP